MSSPVFGVFGAAIAYLQALRNWRERHFHSRVLLSLNTIDRDNVLLIRTLWEKSLSTVTMQNSQLERLVLKAAARTTKDSPFLTFSSKDSWFVYMALLNEISSLFAIGHVVADLNVPGSLGPDGATSGEAGCGEAKHWGDGRSNGADGLPTPPSFYSEWYCFALTAERGPEIHFQKIRILMIKELTLARWAERPRESPSRYPLHRLRWRTLARFAELYREQRQRELATPSGKLGYSDAHHWIRIQVRIPVAHGEGTAGRLPVGQALVNAPA